VFELGENPDSGVRKLPVKLVVVPEGALQGFTDKVMDMDHAEYREEIAIGILARRPSALASMQKNSKYISSLRQRRRHRNTRIDSTTRRSFSTRMPHYDREDETTDGG
jgi:hypothetical protein